MSRLFVILASCLVLLGGCAEMHLHNPFSSDPLTGGENVGTSRLLTLSVPAGMQLFPSHGSTAADGGGLEIYRGWVDMNVVAQYMHSGMQGQGWNVRLARRKDSRAVYVYERTTSMAVLTVERTALGTLLCIWTGERLADGAALPQEALSPALGAGTGDIPAGHDENSGTSYQPGTFETWGAPSAVQERSL